MFFLISPNMLKTYELCPRKFYLRYVKNISMPVNDEIFEFGKNIHALAAYYLRGENIDSMELSLSPRESAVWSYLKSIEYFGYETVGAEYNLSLKLGNSFFGGRLDALVKKDETYYILDYKTGSAPKNAKFDYQTMIYLLAVNRFYNTEKVKFIYIDLKNKEELTVEYSPELGEEYKKRLISAAGKINSNEVPPKKVGCTCEYKAVCF